MLNDYKKFLLSISCNIFLLSFITINTAIAQNIDANTNPDNYVQHNNSDIMLILENTSSMKPIEEITVLDILQDEKTSPELKERIKTLLNQSQYEIDRYRTTINNHYKQVNTKLLELKKEINKLHDFKDNMEVNLSLAKWMIISLSVGIICLTTIVLVMWKSVVNVNRNDVETIYSNEQLRKKLRAQEKRIELLEIAYKRDGKDDD